MYIFFHNMKKWTKKSTNLSYTLLSTSWDYKGFLEFCNINLEYVLYIAISGDV